MTASFGLETVTYGSGKVNWPGAEVPSSKTHYQTKPVSRTTYSSFPMRYYRADA